MKKNHPISYHFAKVMYELLYSDSKYIAPHDFKQVISEKNDLFKKNKAADATDLFRNLIDSFLGDFNSSNEDIKEDIKRDISLNINELKREIEKEIKNNIIYKCINVYNLIIYVCPSTKHKNKIYNFESDSNITFNLENILKSKKDQRSEITLKECFEFSQNKKTNNSFYCSECKEIVIGESFEKLIFPPEILIIILNRGKGKKVKNKVKIDEILDVYDFIYYSNNNNNIYYKLIGSCNHSGESSPKGHYTACCLYEDGNFYYYNDNEFFSCKYYQCFGEDPYILFYRRQYFKEENNSIKNIKIIINTNNDSESISGIEMKKYENIFFQIYKNFNTIEIKIIL